MNNTHDLLSSTTNGTPLEKGTEAWRSAIRFDSTDWGWIIMSIGMAIGAGIVFLPVQVGLLGLWVFLFSSIVSYPALYLFQRLFIKTLVISKECSDYPCVISGYLGKNWGILLGMLYFTMLAVGIFLYSTAITNDSASFIHSFGLSKTLLSDNPWYGLILIILLVSLASRGEKILFKIATGMVLCKVLVIIFLSFSMLPFWDIANAYSVPVGNDFLKQVIVMLPFTLTSIMFMQSLSPMVISYRAKEKSVEVARYKSLRAMKIAFIILFAVVFFYTISFTLAMGHDKAVQAQQENISALAMIVESMSANDQSANTATIKILSLSLNIFAVISAYFGMFLGFREACQGIALNILRRLFTEEKIKKTLVAKGILVFTVLVSWGAILLNAPVLSFTSINSPIFGLIGCLIPAYLVYRVPALSDCRGFSLWIIIATGILLIISPFLAFG